MIPVMISATTAGVRRTLVIALATAGAAALAAAACGPSEPELRGQIDMDTYVEVMSELADLERFPPPGSDEATRSARADSVRREILERHGVTPDGLLDFAETVGARPGLMVEIADRIVAASDSLARLRTGAGFVADSAAADTAKGAASVTTLDTGLEAARESDSVDVSEADSAPAVRRDTTALPRRLEELRRRRDAGRAPSP